MSPLGWTLLVLAVVLFVGGFYSGLRYATRLPSPGPEIMRNARYLKALSRDGGAAEGKDLTDRQTAVYLFFGRYQGRRDVLLYVGIAANPRRRAEQHAEEKPWWGDVEDVEAWWLGNRHVACGVEWFAIKYLRPVYNTAPGGQDDAYCRDLPPITSARFTLPRSRMLR